MTTTLATYRPRPSLLGRNVFDDVFESFFRADFPQHLRRSTEGYPVADIYGDGDGNTVMEFALAGFTKNDLTIDVQPEKRSITVSASTNDTADVEVSRRIARRAFKKTYVNYDDNLDLTSASATFENGLLTIKVPTRVEAQPLSIAID